MPQAGPIPKPDDKFNTYIEKVVPYLNTHQARLQVSNANLTNLNTLFNAPNWKTIFPKSQDSDQRTATITEQKNKLKKQISELLRAIYADIPRSVLTQQDRQVLGIKERDTTPTERPKIEEAPFVMLLAQAGARVQITCRIKEDSTRPSMHPAADQVEVRYLIGTEAEKPANPKACNQNYSSKKTKFTMEFDIADAGKRFYAFFRWQNVSEPQKSGPWSKLYSIVLTD